MRKFVYFAFVFFLTSCTNDENYGVGNETTDAERDLSLKNMDPAKYHATGYGYDITEGFLSYGALKAPVLNLVTFTADDPAAFSTPPPPAETNNTFYYGINSIEYIHSIVEKTNLQGSIGASVLSPEEGQTKSATLEIMPFSKGVTIDQISGKPLPSYSYSSKYSFAHADFWKWLRRYVLDADPTKFANSRYLHPYFVEDLKKVTDANTAYKFVEKYGTNVLTDFVTGGIYRCNYTSSVIKTSNWRETTDVVKAGLEVNLSIVKLGASSETTTEEQIRLNEQNNTYSGRIHTIGGDTNGLSAEFSNENPPKITVDFGAWASTVDDSNSRVITINWDKAYPVYDYITDPTKKALVKAAVHQYIVDSQPNVISTVPFYRYLHDRSVDHFYTTWWNDTQGEGAWRFENVECYILDKPTTGAIPLYEFWNAKWVDHFLTTDPVSSWLGSGWTKTSDIKGYIYTTQKEGTVPLHQYWSERYKDHFFTVHYAPTEGNGEWKYEHIIGYVYPAN